MLKELLKSEYGKEEDFNCAEKMIYGADIIYDLKIDKEALKMAAGFGGGMGIENTCGALTGAIMAISKKYTKTVAHANPEVKEKVIAFLEEFKDEMGTLDCDKLKKEYRTEFKGCDDVIMKAGEILDRIFLEKNNN